jgi:hypothetical protein
MKYLDNVGKRSATVLGLSLALVGSACGDDDSKKNNNTDAAVAKDASPDAASSNASGVVSVTELKISNPEAVAAGLAGGAILVNMSPTSIVPSIGGCTVTEKTAAEYLNPQSAPEAAITITGTSHNASITCAYSDAAKRYVCSLTQGTLAAGSTASDDATDVAAAPGYVGKAKYKIAGANFDAFNPIGGYLVVTGFDDSDANTPAGSTGFPIIGKDSTDTLVVVNPGLEGEVNPSEPDDSDAGVAATYTILAGAGPIPTGAALDFISSTTTIQITKPNGNLIGAFNYQIKPSGANNMELKTGTGYYQPHEMPTAAVTADLKIECMNNCTSATTGAEILGTIINGRTTDTAIPGDAMPWDMPAPTTKYAEFTCTFPGIPPVIKKEDWNKILGTGAKRIETRVFVMTAKTEVVKGMNIVAGHGVVGYTTVP